MYTTVILSLECMCSAKAYFLVFFKWHNCITFVELSAMILKVLGNLTYPTVNTNRFEKSDININNNYILRDKYRSFMTAGERVGCIFG